MNRDEEITVPAALVADLRREMERARDPFASLGTREMAGAVIVGLLWQLVGATCPRPWGRGAER